METETTVEETTNLSLGTAIFMGLATIGAVTVGVQAAKLFRKVRNRNACQDHTTAE